MSVFVYILGVIASILFISFTNKRDWFDGVTVARDFGLFISLGGWITLLSFILVVLIIQFSKSKLAKNFKEWLKEDL